MNQEMLVLKELVHPNIPKVYAVSEDEQCYYIITEYIKGGDLLAVMKANDDGINE